MLGKYRQTVEEQFYPYIRPQETGTKTDIRWWRLLNIGGNGLQFVSDAPFSASALNYTIESLDDGAGKDQRHSPEVEKPISLISVLIKHKQDLHVSTVGELFHWRNTDFLTKIMS